MNTAVAGPQTPEAAYVAIAAGMLVPAIPTDLDVFSPQFPIEGATAGVVYTRRTGKHSPPGDLVHLGIGPLTRRGLHTQLVGALLRAGVLGEASENGRFPAALFAVNSVGWAVRAGSPIGDRDGQLPPELRVLGVEGLDREPDDPARQTALLKFDNALGELQQESVSTVVIVSPHPERGASRKWERLTPVLISGFSVTPGLLTSATTRTSGLVANIDIAPTLLQVMGAPQPASMIGHPIELSSNDPDPLQTLLRMDRIVTANGRATNPVFGMLAVCAAVVLLGGFLAVRAACACVRLFAAGALWLMNMPLALLVAAPLTPESQPVHCALVLGAMTLLAAVEILLSRRRGTASAPVLAAALTVAVVLADAFFGQPLVKFSLLSAYQLQGIRFYGIGNEYMGVVIGAALLIAFLARLPRAAVAGLFFFTAFVIGYPRLGANAGGLVAAAVAFGCGFSELKGRRSRLRTALGWALTGLVAAFALAALDRALYPSSSSHIGGAIQAAQSRGYGYLLEIVWRKLLMNARIVTHPAALAAVVLIGVMVASVISSLRKPGSVASRLFETHPDWAQGLRPAGYGALAAFLFNDSGIVAAIFLLVASLMTGLYNLFSLAQDAPGSPSPAPSVPHGRGAADTAGTLAIDRSE